MYDVITIGGATLDIFMKDQEFEVRKDAEKVDVEEICMVLGDKILVEDVYFTYGGGGMNTASNFSKLGLDVAFIGSVGEDEIGKGILAKLHERGIADEFVLKHADQKSGLSVALHAGERERTILGFRGANNHLNPECIPDDLHKKTQWIYLAHLSGDSHKCLLSLAQQLRKSDMQLMWNPGSTQLKTGFEGMKELLAQTSVLNINKEEAELLSGVEVARDTTLSDDEIDDLSPLFEKIAEMGPQIIVITDGKRGAAVWKDGAMITSKNHDIAETADTTGAGDAFGSGFLAGYISTGKIEEALRWGVVQGGAVITDFGAQNGLLTRSEMEKELEKMDNKKSTA
jgi:ribokinase